MKPTPLSLALTLLLAATGPASAQAGGDHADHGAATDSAATTASGHAHRADLSPYADLRLVEGTSMTADEVAGLREGLGMRLALPAELNGFPGPLHVLELREELGLDAAQAGAVERIRAAMLAEATTKGEAIIAADRALASAFRKAAAGEADRPTPDAVDRLAARLAHLQGQLQAIHLRAHLGMMDVLRPDQVAAYQRLRGYGAHGGHQ